MPVRIVLIPETATDAMPRPKARGSRTMAAGGKIRPPMPARALAKPRPVLSQLVALAHHFTSLYQGTSAPLTVSLSAVSAGDLPASLAACASAAACLAASASSCCLFSAAIWWAWLAAAAAVLASWPAWVADA